MIRLNHDIDNSRIDLCYFFRFRIKNIGNRPANNVEVVLKNISQIDKDKNSKIYDKFIPLNLGWSFENGKKNLERLNPGMEKHCDLGYISHPQHKQIIELVNQCNQEDIPFTPENNILFIVSFVVKPKIIQSYVLKPAHYKIQLICNASNAKMKSTVLEFKFDEKWSDNFNEMISEIHLKKIE